MIHENLVEINLVDDCIIADLVEIVNTNKTRRSRTKKHEYLVEILCPYEEKKILRLDRSLASWYAR